MRTPGDLRFVVHVAGGPSPDHVQRCAVCGFELVDNAGWGAGLVAVPDTDTDRRPGWFPAGALVATDKTQERRSGMSYVLPSGKALSADEKPCV